jgi:hypothetical protein
MKHITIHEQFKYILSNKILMRNTKASRAWWYTPVIPATLETEARGMQVQREPEQSQSELVSKKHKQRMGSMPWSRASLVNSRDSSQCLVQKQARVI